MIRSFSARSVIAATVIAATTLVSTLNSHAITVSPGFSFTPSTNAPLAGQLQLATDVNTRISVLVSDGTGLWERDFYDYSTNHSEILLGFKPNQTNTMQITVHDESQNSYTVPQLLTFVTASLPTNFPVYTVLTNQPDAMEPGYFLFIVSDEDVAAPGYITIMDNYGNVVWYSISPWQGASDVRQLPDGNLFIQEAGTTNCFQEINMLGQVVQTWPAAPGYPINPHEGLVTSHGTILYLSDQSVSVANFPESNLTTPNPNSENIDDNPIVEISYTNSALLHEWSPLNMIDPTRVTYLTYGGGFSSTYGIDNEHGNAIVDDTNDNSIIYSLRNQDAVIKFSRATGQIVWILGPPQLWGADWQQYLLTPEGPTFNWNYGQHAPTLTPEGTLLLYNDNNFAACPFNTEVPNQNNYSSAIEYSINETNMQVSEVWNSAWQTNQDVLFTSFIGRAQWLTQTRNILVTFGAVSYINGQPTDPNNANATMFRLKEYTHDPIPQVVFDLSFYNYTNTSSSYGGYDCYRAYQVADLYAHPAEPVEDLAVQWQEGVPVLQFSGDPDLNYTVEASPDLVNWTTVGTPVENGVGEYDFEDLDASQYTARYYRVITQSPQ